MTLRVTGRLLAKKIPNPETQGSFQSWSSTVQETTGVTSGLLGRAEDPRRVCWPPMTRAVHAGTQARPHEMSPYNLRHSRP